MLIIHIMEVKLVELIRIKDLEKKYKTGVTAIYDFDLKVKKGDFVFVIGQSGSGKSTLIKLLYREEKPTNGSINIGGIEVAKLRNRKVYKLRRKLGIVFQDYKLLPRLTVYENVAFALEILGLPNEEIRNKTLKALEQVGLKNKSKNYPNELSGGEQQRVAIARALVNRPAILLCDEPTGNLDPANSAEIMKILNQANKQGTTVLVVTHNMEIVQQMKKRTITMSEGKIISDLEKGGYFYED